MNFLESWRSKGIMTLVALMAIAGTTLGSRTPVVSAHPLGNFTINHYSRIELGTDTVSLRYIIDMAEIPAFQEISRMDLDQDGYLSDDERSNYISKEAVELQQGVRLSISETPMTLILAEQELSLPPGQGGLSTLRLNLLFQAEMPRSQSAGEQVLEYRDENYPQRIGWKEIIVRAGEGIALVESSAPPTDVSNELQAYPTELTGSPLDQTYARSTFRFAGPGPSSKVQVQETESQSAVPSEDFLGSLLSERRFSLPLLLASLVVALGLGALHAMSPGHGKTIMAAYLVGTRGTALHALFLGMTVTVSHTIGVVVLGLVVLYASHIIAPEALYPWLGVASGAVIIAIGLGLLFNRRRSSQANRDHGHPHSHSHPHPHSHHHFESPSSIERFGEGAASPPQADRIIWRSLAALGIVGGLVPSTSALVLLLTAISLHRVGVGLLLVLAFSAGMALVLGGVGLALVYAARTIERVNFQKKWIVRITREVSLIAALVVLVSGVVMIARSLQQLGVA